MNTSGLSRLGILSHHPGEAAPGSEHVWPETSGDETPTYLHPAVVIAAVSGYVWFLLVSWVVFFGYGYMGVMSLVQAISGSRLVSFRRPLAIDRRN